jgi:site-specific DNA-methyltransferase (adenine-specific)
MRIKEYTGRANIKLINADCMDILPDFKENEFDLAIVDVNYGIKEDGRKTKGRTFRKDGSHRLSIDKRNGRKSLIYNEYTSKNWDEKQPDQKYFDLLFKDCSSHLIFGENYLRFNQKNNSSGRIFWDKVNYTNDFSDGEMIWTNLFSSVRKFEFMWNGMLQGKNIKEGKINQGNKKLCEKRFHPTQKPTALYKWLLTEHAKQGQTILDTHFGSLSIGIACWDLGFDLVAIEKYEEYFDKAVERFEIHISQKQLF